VIFIGVLALNLSKSRAAFENLEITELSFIQENTLIAVSEPCYIDGYYWQMDDYCWQNVNADVGEYHPIYDPNCHLVVCEWLLRTDGIEHWNEWSGPYNLEIFKTIDQQLTEIIKRESGGDPKICNRDDCGSGMGLCQFISTTWNDTLEKMKEEYEELNPGSKIEIN